MDILDDMGVSKLSAKVFWKWTTPLTKQLGLSIFDPTLGLNNPAFLQCTSQPPVVPSYKEAHKPRVGKPWPRNWLSILSRESLLYLYS